MRVGVIGLGIMGAPMARNLLRAGHEVVVHGRTAARVEPLVAAGARAAASPAAVASAVDAVVTSLPDGPDVELVVGGPDGVLAGAARGLLVIDTSTIAPDTARALASRTSAIGVDFLDAPVSGGQQGAIDGTLSIMVGGAPDAFARARPVFEALGRTATHMGGPGQGQMTKLVNQVIGVTTLAAVAEGLTLAAHAGLDPDAVLAAVGGGAATSWQLTNLGPAHAARRLGAGIHGPPAAEGPATRARRGGGAARPAAGDRGRAPAPRGRRGAWRRRPRHAGPGPGARGARGRPFLTRRSRVEYPAAC